MTKLPLTYNEKSGQVIDALGFVFCDIVEPADAKLIVVAVNNFAPMIEALDAFLVAYETVDNYCALNEAEDKARAVIANIVKMDNRK